MLKRILLPVIFALLTWGFWVSPDFKEIAAGVSIFLFGMLFLEEGFRAFTGGLLERLLKKTTNRQWKAIAFGAVSTSIMQSSSLVSVIAISFLSTGLIWLPSGIGIIFGANIGTTTGAWLVAGLGLKVKISAYAMPMLVFGIILVFQKSKNLKGIGYILAGLGFLFLGIHYMKEGFEAFKDTIDLAAYAMPGFGGLIVFALIGVFATVVMQSSHATLVLIITALAASQITYENALALAIGANIGTTVTAIIGSMSSNYQGKRLAAAHLIFNIVTGAIAVIFIQQLVWMVDMVSVQIGIADNDYTLKLAVFHTIFNVIGVMVMVPAVSPLVVFLRRMIPRPVIAAAEPRFINKAAFDFPETLLGAVRNETLHLFDNAYEILAHGLNLHRCDIQSDRDLEEAIRSDRKIIDLDLDATYITRVKMLYGAILDFIIHAQTKLPPDFSDRLFELRNACHSIVKSVKNIGGMRDNIVEYIESDNEDVRRQYDAIRLQLGMLLRTLYRLSQESDEERSVLVLDEFKVTVDEKDTIADGTLDRLIRKRRIDTEMATSLMNDLSFARNTVWDLVEMGKAVYGATETDIREAEAFLALTDSDVNEIQEKKGTKKNKHKTHFEEEV